MAQEHRSNPFGWVVLGFVAGVLATFGAILFVSSSLPQDEEEAPELRTAADDAAVAVAAEAPAPVTVPAPAREEAPVAAPTDDPAAPRRSAPLDPQVAEDAAAVGMTSRAEPDPSTDR